MNFKQILSLLTESKLSKDSLNKVLEKYGKVTSNETNDGKSIVFLVNLGSDKEKAIKLLDKIEEITGRANLVSDGKTFSGQIYIPNDKYVSPKTEPLDKTDHIYGRTKHGEGGSLGS